MPTGGPTDCDNILSLQVAGVNDIQQCFCCFPQTDAFIVDMKFAPGTWLFLDSQLNS